MTAIDHHAIKSTLAEKTISFIGGGNMAQALISGLITCGIDPKQIIVSAPSDSTRQIFDSQGLQTVDAKAHPKDAVTGADVVILAVKPQLMADVVQDFAAALEHQLVISVAAGLSVASLSTMLGGYRHIIRVMPNTPSTIQMGASALFAADEVSAAQKALAEAVVAASGLTLWVDSEEKMHAVTAVSGSAPAYVFYFLESMILGAQQLGLSHEEASALAMQTVLGAASMALQSDELPKELRRRVTSPNGTTQAAIETMQRLHVGEHIIEAMKACAARSQELSGTAN